jgi:hypothetical protein
VFPASEPLRRPDDALRVVMAAVSHPPTPETVVLLLDDEHRGGTCLVCRGAATAPQVATLVPLLVETAARERSLGAAVMATRRPGQGIQPSAEDDTTFIAMRYELAVAGVELLDWFLLDDGLIASVGELMGACWLWRDEEPPW